MVRYELPTGKTILISWEDYLDMTDEKLREYIARDAGIFIEDPFSSLDHKEFNPKNYDLPEVEKVEDLDEDTINKIKSEIHDEKE